MPQNVFDQFDTVPLPRKRPNVFDQFAATTAGPWDAFRGAAPTRGGMFDDLIPAKPLSQSGPWARYQNNSGSDLPPGFVIEGQAPNTGNAKRPIFDIQGPDGKIHSIEGPEGSTPEQALKAL